MILAEILSSGWTFGLSGAFALSAVALIGYLFGRSQRTLSPADGDTLGNEEIQRATRIAKQLEQIADDLRQDLALHRQQVERFKSQLRRAEGEDSEEAWRRLRDEAETMVGPTLQLVSQLSSAYDRIRQQSQSLAVFTGGRTDPLTGLANSRSLEEHLDVVLRSRTAGGGESSVVVVSLDGDSANRSERDECVRRVGKQLAQELRDEDFAARYGVDDFVVVLPATPVAGASVFATRLRQSVRHQQSVSLSCGLAESMPADTPKSLLARADSAAYSARAAGTDCQFIHTGAAIRPESRVRPAAKSASKPRVPQGLDAGNLGDSGTDGAEHATPSPAPAAVDLAGPPVTGGLVVSPLD